MKSQIKSRFFKVLFLMAVLFVPVFSYSVNAAQPQAISVYLDGKKLVFDVNPTIINDYTMVPIGQTIQFLTGKAPEWNDATKTMTFTAGGDIITHTVGEKRIFINGMPKDYPTSSLIIDSRTLVPVRMLADATKCDIKWDALTKSVIMTSPAAPSPSPSPSAAASPSPSPSPTPAKPAVVALASDNIIIDSGSSAVITVSASTGTTRAKLLTDQNVFITETSEFIEAKDSKVFMLQCKPEASQNYKVVVGDSTQYYEQDSKAAAVTVLSQPEIINVGTSQTNAKPGDTITVTVTTNLSTDIVKLTNTKSYNNSVESKEFYLNNNQKIFTLKWTVNEQGNIDGKVYAGNNNGYNVDYRLVSVTTALAAVDIIDVIPQTSVTVIGVPITVNVITSVTTSKVWLSTASKPTIMESTVYSTDQLGRKVFKLTWTPDTAGYQALTVNAADAGTNKDFMNFNIAVNQPNLTAQIETISNPVNQITEGGSMMFTVITNRAVESVWYESGIVKGEKSYDYTEFQTDKRIFQIICTPKIPGGNAAVMAIYAQDTKGNKDSRNFKIDVQPNPIVIKPVINVAAPMSFDVNMGEPLEIEVRTDKTAMSVVARDNFGAYATGVLANATTTENVYRIKLRPMNAGSTVIHIQAYSPAGTASDDKQLNINVRPGTQTPLVYNVKVNPSKIRLGAAAQIYVETNIWAKNIELNIPFAIINTYATANTFTYVIDAYPAAIGNVDIIIKALNEGGLSTTYNATLEVVNLP